MADITAKAQNAEWYVGRAYSLLQEVRGQHILFYFIYVFVVFVVVVGHCKCLEEWGKWGGGGRGGMCGVVSCMIICSGACLRGFRVCFCQFSKF